MAFEKDGVQQIDTKELVQIVERQPRDIVLVDVREHEEYRTGHIPGIKLLPVSEFAERYAQELDKEGEYIFICQSGQRSQMVCQFLQENGYRKCRNYAGGMSGWMGPLE